MQPASVQGTDISFLTCRSPRHTVRTFRFSHAVALGTEYGPFVSHMQPASVQGTDLSFLTCRRPRYTVQTFRFSHAAGFGTQYGPFVSHMQPASVQGRSRSCHTCSRPRYKLRTFVSYSRLRRTLRYYKINTPTSWAVAGI